jgi:hypothetical protein
MYTVGSRAFGAKAHIADFSRVSILKILKYLKEKSLNSFTK